ncbi:hypothetical protein [Spirillospora sp. NPDC047279]|uniref:hypothetical protein n=1 Tax=Spirillospora sp. NPDC047279 TaxID=3155478 RepID=UPI0033F997EC
MRPTREDGGFGRFVQNRAVQLVGAGLIGIFIAGGAVATGVAVAGGGGTDRGERPGWSRQWQAPDGGQGGGGLPGGGFGGNGPGSGY